MKINQKVLANMILCLAILTISIYQAILSYKVSSISRRLDNIEFSMLMKDYNGSINFDDNVMGYYHDDYIAVRLEDYFSERTIRNTMSHELGHYYYYDYLNFIERKRWNDLYGANTSFITDYASSEANEDFAESFAHVIKFCYDEEKVSDLSDDKARFLDETVKVFFTRCK